MVNSGVEAYKETLKKTLENSDVTIKEIFELSFSVHFPKEGVGNTHLEKLLAEGVLMLKKDLKVALATVGELEKELKRSKEQNVIMTGKLQHNREEFDNLVRNMEAIQQMHQDALSGAREERDHFMKLWMDQKEGGLWNKLKKLLP